MEQLQEEVPEVKEEEEEEAVMVASGASDPTGGPDSSLPSSSYTGEWSHRSLSKHPQPQAACSAARAEDLSLDGVQLVLISTLCEIMLQVMERLISSSEVTAQPLVEGFGVEIIRTGR